MERRAPCRRRSSGGRHHTAATARWHAGSEGHGSVEGSRLKAGPHRGGHHALRPCAGSLQGEEEKGGARGEVRRLPMQPKYRLQWEDYLKDLREILHRIIHGGVSTRKPGKQARLAAEGGGLVARAHAHPAYARFARFRSRTRMPSRGRRIEVSGLARRNKKRTRRARIAASQRRDLEEAAQAAVARRKKRADSAATAVQRYTRDQNYRLLHDMTAEVFADLLAEDLKKLSEGNMDLSLAGKWCPSVDSCYDRSTLICEAIARRLFPKCSARDLPEDLPDAHYTYRVCERLRKEAYVPLRHALKLPEIFISAGEWAKVVYTRVSSVAMKNYKDHFVYYDQASPAVSPTWRPAK
ncbi:hypothetical protein TRIUR3_14186 [Triticum urartu]|uniref:DUF2828 domain-containing protein n=1 Tax=Triticum urartu TaxID=4572 RepID=M7YYD5_TRIUA|nr:hypothetical protein TRIUR3_14186 [Triticum urartu]